MREALVNSRGGGKVYSMLRKYELEYEQILHGLPLDGQPREIIIVNMARAVSELGAANYLKREDLLLIMVVEYHKALCEAKTQLVDHIKRHGK